jgi:hypothetical protein
MGARGSDGDYRSKSIGGESSDCRSKLSDRTEVGASQLDTLQTALVTTARVIFKRGKDFTSRTT